jgi:hypothetical protein
MDVFRLGAIVARAFFLAVNPDYEWLLCTDQRLTDSEMLRVSRMTAQAK